MALYKSVYYYYYYYYYSIGSASPHRGDVTPCCELLVIGYACVRQARRLSVSVAKRCRVHVRRKVLLLVGDSCLAAWFLAPVRVCPLNGISIGSTSRHVICRAYVLANTDIQTDHGPWRHPHHCARRCRLKATERHRESSQIKLIYDFHALKAVNLFLNLRGGTVLSSRFKIISKVYDEHRWLL